MARPSDPNAGEAPLPASHQSPTASSPAVLEFQTVGGRKNKATTWSLTGAYVAELAGQFPAVDVESECRKALGWTRLKPENRKTSDGMRNFLWKWMQRQSDRGGSRGTGPRHPSDPDAFVRVPHDDDEVDQIMGWGKHAQSPKEST